jgi:hypothetical protein
MRVLVTTGNNNTTAHSHHEGEDPMTTTTTATAQGIRCGNRKAHGTDRVYHATSEEVRNCFAGQATTAPTAPAATGEADRVLNNGGPLFPATEKQLSFLRSLATDRSWDGLSAADRGRLQLWLAGDAQLAKGAASDFITALKAQPYKATAPAQAATLPNGSTAPAPVPAVADGRYALDGPEGEGTRFYVVNTPTEGRWARFTFVDVQASDERHAIRNRAERTRILEEIAKDPQAAMLRYGREIGSCGHCGRTLTNDESRAYGIGPICRGKMGW